MARAAGIGLAITGVLVAAGMVPSIVSSYTSMTVSEDDNRGGDTMTIIQNDNTNNNDNDLTMSDSSPKASMYISDDGLTPTTASVDESHSIASDYNSKSVKPMDNDNGNGQTGMTDME